MQNRKGESQRKSWYRSERYFRSGNNWYFATREKWDIGPFKAREEAELAVSRYLKAIQERKPHSVARKHALLHDYEPFGYE